MDTNTRERLRRKKVLQLVIKDLRQAIKIEKDPWKLEELEQTLEHQEQCYVERYGSLAGPEETTGETP